MHDFGKKLLNKFGWNEGKGLGKEENGISQAIKPKLKFDLSGVGFNKSDEFTFSWWDHAFNKTVQNLNVTGSKDEITENVSKPKKSKQNFVLSTTKNVVHKRSNKSTLYGNFVKSKDTLHEKPSVCDNSESDSEEEFRDLSCNLSDDQLFQICGGQTAHKGARHGITMSGKLRRLEIQEEAFIRKQCDEIKSKVKPILKDTTPRGSTGKLKRKSVHFSGEVNLKVFSYVSKNDNIDCNVKLLSNDDVELISESSESENLNVDQMSSFDNDSSEIDENRSNLIDIEKKEIIVPIDDENTFILKKTNKNDGSKCKESVHLEERNVVLVDISKTKVKSKSHLNNSDRRYQCSNEFSETLLNQFEKTKKKRRKEKPNAELIILTSESKKLELINSTEESQLSSSERENVCKKKRKISTTTTEGEFVTTELEIEDNEIIKREKKKMKSEFEIEDNEIIKRVKKKMKSEFEIEDNEIIKRKKKKSKKMNGNNLIDEQIASEEVRRKIRKKKRKLVDSINEEKNGIEISSTEDLSLENNDRKRNKKRKYDNINESTDEILTKKKKQKSNKSKAKFPLVEDMFSEDIEKN